MFLTFRLRYGHNQVVVGIAQKTLESGSNGEKQSKKKLGDIFLQFESPQIGSNQIEYLVRSSLVQLCCGLQRGGTSVSQSAWSHWTGLAKVVL